MKYIKYLLLILILSSCQQQGQRIRIVDKDGNPARINKITPQFNEEQLERQKQALLTQQQPQQLSAVNQLAQQNYHSQNDINTKNTTIIQDNTNILEENNRIKYPKDIFADRITNYNYIEDNNFSTDNQNNYQNLNYKTLKNQYQSSENGEILEEDIIVLNDFEKKEIKEEQEKYQKNKQNESINQLQTNNEYNSNNDISIKNTTPITKNNNSKGIYIQIGIYSKKINATKMYNKYKSINTGTIEEYNSKGKKQYKVILGPYTDRKVAEKDLTKVIKTGHYDVYITENK